jgi:hypothetical protein
MNGWVISLLQSICLFFMVGVITPVPCEEFTLWAVVIQIVKLFCSFLSVIWFLFCMAWNWNQWCLIESLECIAYTQFAIWAIVPEHPRDSNVSGTLMMWAFKVSCFICWTQVWQHFEVDHNNGMLHFLGDTSKNPIWNSVSRGLNATLEQLPSQGEQPGKTIYTTLMLYIA